jgi:hypothetical protein
LKKIAEPDDATKVAELDARIDILGLDRIDRAWTPLRTPTARYDLDDLVTQSHA